MLPPTHNIGCWIRTHAHRTRENLIGTESYERSCPYSSAITSSGCWRLWVFSSVHSLFGQLFSAVFLVTGPSLRLPCPPTPARPMADKSSRGRARGVQSKSMKVEERLPLLEKLYKVRRSFVKNSYSWGVLYVSVEFVGIHGWPAWGGSLVEMVTSLRFGGCSS